ncbi:MAG TPA: hypothetical protein VH680_08700 [Gemmatimonadales bacterium]
MVREARLLPEFAAAYPGVDTETWYAAATLAEHLLGRIVRGEMEEPPVPRVLNPQHFEFRGEGTPNGARVPIGDEAKAGPGVILRRAPHH